MTTSSIKKIVILTVLLISIIVGVIVCRKKQETPPVPTKIDSLKTEIIKIDHNIDSIKENYEKTCSIISGQSFADDTLFFTDYLTRFKLRNNSGTIEAH